MGGSLTPVAAGFRDADERLLERLRDEAAVAALWGADAPKGADPLPRRALVVAREAARLEGGAAAVDRAASGDAAALSAILRGPVPGRSPRLWHALANYFERLATATGAAAAREEGAGRRDHAAQLREREVDARIRSLSYWIALAAEASFLEDLARQIAGDSLSDAEARAEGRAAPERAIDDLARVAAAGAKDLDGSARAALAALARVHEAAKRAPSGGDVSAAFVRRADRARARAVDDALASYDDALQDARSRAASPEEYAAVFERVRDVWVWAHRDVAVEHFAVDQLTPIAWDLYRGSSWASLRVLLAPCEPLFENLESRLLARPEEIAYAAKCAQILVFRSEAETDRAREWAYAERALKVCPTHRNGRLVLSHLLSERAIHTLDRSTIFTGRADVREMTAYVERAESLFPQGKRAQEARAKLEAARARWGVHG